MEPGYLKFSVSIVGPHDKVKVHPDNEDEGGSGSNKADGKDVGSLVLVPPTVKMRRMWLVATVHFAEYLPKMDSSNALLGSAGGIDAYFTLKFGDMKRPFRTKVGR